MVPSNVSFQKTTPNPKPRIKNNVPQPRNKISLTIKTDKYKIQKIMNETGGQKSVISTGLHREPIYFVLEGKILICH